MKGLYLERIYFMKKTPDSLTKFRKQRITAADFIKNHGKIFRKS